MLLDRAHQEEIWYREARWLHGIWSKIIKSLSILLVGFGTLCPLINNSFPKLCLEISWGYLSLSTGGIIMLFDKYFSLSSGFQRFYVAELEIIRLTEAFIIEWESEASGTQKKSEDERLSNLLKVAKNFDANISKVITNETNNWSNEFAKHMEDLQNTFKNKNRNAQ